jgi:hypothetical protein
MWTAKVNRATWVLTLQPALMESTRHAYVVLEWLDSVFVLIIGARFTVRQVP